MATEALDTLPSAILVLEATAGEFETPVAADFNFPLGIASYGTDPRMTEGMSDANGKKSPANMYSQGLLGNVEITSRIMEPVDPTVATGEIEIAPLFLLSGFRLDSTATNFALLWDGNTNCETASMVNANRGCGTAATGFGTDFRGMMLSLSMIAETTSSEIALTATGQAAIEGVPMTSKTIIADEYINDAFKRNYETFVGSLNLDGADVPADGLSIIMNSELKEQRNPATGKNGLQNIYSTGQSPMVDITAPVGADTATWWPNIIAGKVIDTLVYTGTYIDITMTDLVIANIAKTADGKVKLTQSFAPSTIRIDFK